MYLHNPIEELIEKKSKEEEKRRERKKKMTVKTLIQKPKPNLLRQFANFTRTTAGLEKTCRLIQSLAQLAIELDITPGSTTTAQWQTARSQIALSKSHKPLRKKQIE